MPDIPNSWSVPGAALPTSFPSASSYPSLRNRGWFIAWVCSAVGCMAAAALTRYPQPASLTAGVSFEIVQQTSAGDGPHVSGGGGGPSGPAFPLADGNH